MTGVRAFSRVSLLVLALFASKQAFAVNPALLYRPSAIYAIPLEPDVYPTQITYMTAGGFPRTVPIAVWTPAGAPTPLPVVILAHGGDARTVNASPAGSMREWSKEMARAGYLAIAVTHLDYSPAESLLQCQAIGFPIVQDPGALTARLHEIVDALGGASSVDVGAIIEQFPQLFAAHQDTIAQLIQDSGLNSSGALEFVRAVLQEPIEGCRSINEKGLWDRPKDMQAVMDALVSGTIPQLSSVADVSRIVVGGHSNGTNSALSVVGHQRVLPNGVLVPRPNAPGPSGDTHAIAAVVFSPHGPTENGVFDTSSSDVLVEKPRHSWQGIDVPVFSVTGDGDDGCRPHRFLCGGGDSGSTRRIPFLRMPSGDKYLLYLGDRNAVEIVTYHTFFELNLEKCRSAYVGQCQEMKAWLVSSVLAFLDAYVKGSESALQWLQSDRIARVSRGIARLSRK